MFSGNVGGGPFGGAITVGTGVFQGNITSTQFTGNVLGVGAVEDSTQLVGGALGISGTLKGNMDGVTFDSNRALGLNSLGGAVGVVAIDGNITGSTFINNRAGNGGALVSVSGMTGTVSTTIFDGNQADRSGGAVYSTSGTMSFTNPSFTNNRAGENGGAVFTQSTLNLTVTAGGTGTFSGNTDASGANSVFVNGGGAVNVSVAANGVLDMQDPLRGTAASGKSIAVTKTGAGTWRLGGASVFTASGGSTAFNHSDGELYLLHPTGATRAAFSPQTRAVTAAGAIHLSGTGSSFTTASGTRLRIGGGNAITITSTPADYQNDTAQGTIALNSGKMDFDLGNATPTNAAYTANPMLFLKAGTLAINDTIVVNLTSMPGGGGPFLLVKKQAGGSNFALGSTVSSALTYKGQALTSSRYTDALKVAIPDGDTILLTPGLFNANIEWTSVASRTWNVVDELWLLRDDAARPAAPFIAGDAVYFTGTGQGAVRLDEEMAASSLNIIGGKYSFSGEALVSANSVANLNGSTSSPVNLTRKATISGNGTVATFANMVDFAGGMTIGAGAAAVVRMAQGGQFAARMAVAANGRLELDTGPAVRAGRTYDGAVTGTGTVEKTGTGLLAMTGSLNSFTGTFKQTAGDVALASNLGGSYSQTTGLLTTAPNLRIGKNGAFNGTVSPGGDRTVSNLAIGGTAALSGATLNLDFTRATTDTITVNDAVTLAGTTNIKIILGEWVPGTYTVLTSSGISGDRLFNTGATYTNTRRTSMAEVVDNRNIVVTLGNGENRNLYWTGADTDINNAGKWHCAAENWETTDGDAAITQFLDGDSVYFVNSTATVDVCKPGSVFVTAMEVREGSKVAFTTGTGSKLYATTRDNVAQHATDPIDVTRKLLVTGAGTEARFEVGVDFAGGIEVADQALAVFADEVVSGQGVTVGDRARAVLADGGDMADAVDVRFAASGGVFAVERDEDYVWKHALSGAGTLANEGQGTLWFNDSFAWTDGTLQTQHNETAVTTAAVGVYQGGIGLGFADDGTPATIEMKKVNIGKNTRLTFNVLYNQGDVPMTTPLLKATEVTLAGRLRAEITDLDDIQSNNLAHTKTSTVIEAGTLTVDGATLSGHRALYSYEFLRNTANPNFLDLVISGREDTTPQLLARSDNSHSLAGALQAGSPGLGGELEAHWHAIINAADENEMNSLFREINGTQLVGSTNLVSLSAARLPNWLKKNPLGHTSILDALNGYDETAAGVASEAAYASPGNAAGGYPWRFIASGLGETTRLHGTDGEPGYRITAWGGALSVDRMLHDAQPGNGWRMGAAIQFDHSRMRWSQFGGKANANTVSGSLYARAESGRWFASAMVDYDSSRVKTHRNLPTSGLSASSEYTSPWYGGGLYAGYVADLFAQWEIIPQASLQYTRVTVPEVHEHGAGTLSQRMEKTHQNSVTVGANVEVSRLFRCGERDSLAAWRPWLSLGVSGETKDNVSRVKTGFIGEAAVPHFTSTSPDVGRIGFEAGAGIRAALNHRTQLNVEYAGDFRSHRVTHSGTFSVEFRF